MDFWQAFSFNETRELVHLATVAEDAGFTGVGFADHLVTPATIRSRYPYTEDGTIWWDPVTHWPDPWVMSAVLASHTTTLRFVTSIYVLPMHELFGVAKAVSTAAVVSGNRVTLGIGVGWMAEEFELTGQDFHTRGRRTDEMLAVMARLFEGGMVEHHGEFFDVPPVTMSPAPSEPVPVWVGGESEVALARAARHEGWFGGGPYLPDQVPPLLERLAAHRTAAGRAGEPFDVVVGLATPPDLDTFKRLADAGVTGFGVLPWYYTDGPSTTVEAKVESMRRFSDTFISALTGY